MSAGPLVVTYPLTGRSREIVAEELDGTAEAIYLVDLAPADRVHALGRAGAVLSHDTSKELRPDEILLIRNARLLQFTAAGVDWVPTRDLPQELPVAANKGGGAEPMSEHIVALALAAAKRLFIEHANLKRGEFNQRSANRMLRGGVCGILGFGNVGVATARLMRAFGMKNHAINRHLRRHGFEGALDHRSFLRRGLDIEAEAHMGPGDAQRERSGERTEVGDYNRGVRERNAERLRLREREALDQAAHVRHSGGKKERRRENVSNPGKNLGKPRELVRIWTGPPCSTGCLPAGARSLWKTSRLSYPVPMPRPGPMCETAPAPLRRRGERSIAPSRTRPSPYTA